MSRLQEIRARLEAATPGPWEYDSDALIHAPIDDSVSDSYFLFVPHSDHCDGYEVPTPDCLADAELIANAPADLAYLLEALEAKS